VVVILAGFCGMVVGSMVWLKLFHPTVLLLILPLLHMLPWWLLLLLLLRIACPPVPSVTSINPIHTSA
jgi:hypothetical protein